MRKVVTPRWAEYGEAVAGQAIVDVAVDHGGHPVLLTTDRADLPPSPTRFCNPDLTFRHAVPLPRRFRIVRLAPEGPRVISLGEPSGWLSQVQPLPAGRWLLLPADALDDATYLVAAPDGRLEGTIPLEAPEHFLNGVVTTPDGHLWSHYDDHSAWNGRGLQCHDEGGRLVHGAEDLPGAGEAWYRGYTYALTPSGPGEVHVYVYGAGFSLFVMDAHRVTRSWIHLPIEGASSFAISATHALFGPGYDGRRRLTLVDLAGRPDRWSIVPTTAGHVARYEGRLKGDRLAPVDERGRPVGFVRTAARGDVLWLFTHDAVYGAAVAEVARPDTDQAPAIGRDQPSGLEPTLGG